MISFDPVNRAALAQYPQLLHDWFPAGKVKGHEFLTGDLRGSPGESLSINIQTGAWADFASIEKGGDPVSLFKAVFKVPTQGAAAEQLAKQLGVNGAPAAHQPARPEWEPVLPPPPFASAPDLAGFDKVYTYRDQSGEALFYIRRKEAAAGGRKLFTPLTYGKLNGQAGWHPKHPTSPRPLYGLEKLKRSGRVLLCEGEKAADAAQQTFPDLVCMAWPGGANGIKQVDWAPLKGRDVILWPDNDKAGKDAMAEISAIIGGITLRVDDLPEKGDAADVIPDDPAAWLSAHLPKQTTALPLVFFDDIEPCLDVRDFVQGVLVEEGAAVVYGESNAGKTFWTTDLALHVAAGKEWNGRRVEGGGVIYCVLEGGAGFRNRVAAWRSANYLDGAGIPFAAIPAGLNLLDPEADAPKLVQTIQAAKQQMGVPVKLIVIDTLSRAMAGGNENAPDDMGALVRNMDAIRTATGACVLFVHHSGKDAAKGARGHSLLRAAVDTEIEVVVCEGETKTATIVKQRELKKGDVFGFKLTVAELGTNRHGEQVTTCVVQPVEAGTAVKAGLKFSGHQKRAIDVLQKVLGASGRTGDNGIPSGYASVPEKFWRDEFYQSAMPGDDQETKQKAFKRASQALLDNRAVGMASGRVWIIEKKQ
jgi:hypothetical protein